MDLVNKNLERVDVIGANVEKSSQKFNFLRLIILWNPKTKSHVYFLTNVSEKVLSLLEVAEIYRIRWQIELIFKELKSYSGVKKFLTSSEHIVEGFLWLGLTTLLFRRYLIGAGQLFLDKKLSFFKGGDSANNFMPRLINSILFSTKAALKKDFVKLFLFFDKMLFKSNKNRQNSFDRVGLLS